MMKKIVFAGVGLSMLAMPLVTSAQTSSSSNASLIAILTQLVQILEQELQQLIAAQGGSSIPTTPSTNPSNPTVCMAIYPICGAGYHVGGSCNNQCIPNTTSNSLSASPTSGAAPLTVVFTTQTGATLNFGDGQSSSVASAQCTGSGNTSTGVTSSSCTPVSTSHTYASSGTYNATLVEPAGYSCPVTSSASTQSGCTWQSAQTLAMVTVVVGGSGSSTIFSQPSQPSCPTGTSYQQACPINSGMCTWGCYSNQTPGQGQSTGTTY